MSGVCWAQPPQLSHTVRGTKFHGLQFKAKGQETFTVTYTLLQLGSSAIVRVCYLAYAADRVHALSWSLGQSVLMSGYIHKHIAI